MNLIIIGGFLGSGKTTILISIAKYLTDKKKLKVAIIENEIGKVGIDGEHIKEHGLEVKEIYSGCICCTLRSDIIQTLLTLERDYNPDVVLLEPSGVANPREVIKCLDGYGGEINQKQVLTVIDSARFKQLEDYSLPLISNSINLANMVVINKIDLLSEQEIIKIEERIKKINGSVTIMHTSEAQISTLNALNDAILIPIKSDKPTFRIAPNEQTVKTHENAISFAKELDIQFADRISNKAIQERTIALLNGISLQIKEQGCILIGHLKAIVKAQNKGYLLASKTSFSHPTQLKGKLANSISEIRLVINLIVYDIDKEKLRCVAENEITKTFKNADIQ